MHNRIQFQNTDGKAHKLLNMGFHVNCDVLHIFFLMNRDVLHIKG